MQAVNQQLLSMEDVVIMTCRQAAESMNDTA